MRNKTITFRRAPGRACDLYIVESLGNRIVPRVGDVLKPSEVRHYIAMSDTTVTIKEARK